MEVHHIHYLEDSILIRDQLYPNWSIPPIQFESKSQKAFFAEINKGL